MHGSFRGKGQVDGRACITEMEANGLTNILLVGRGDLTISEILATALASGVGMATSDASGKDITDDMEGFLEGADAAVGALQAQVVEGSQRAQSIGAGAAALNHSHHRGLPGWLVLCEDLCASASVGAPFFVF